MASVSDITGEWKIKQVHDALKDLADHDFPKIIIDEERDDDPQEQFACPWCEQSARASTIHAVRFLVQGHRGRDGSIDWNDKDVTFWFNIDDDNTTPERIGNRNLYDYHYFVHTTCGNPVALPEGWRVFKGD